MIVWPLILNLTQQTLSSKLYAEISSCLRWSNCTNMWPFCRKLQSTKSIQMLQSLEDWGFKIQAQGRNKWLKCVTRHYLIDTKAGVIYLNSSNLEKHTRMHWNCSNRDYNTLCSCSVFHKQAAHHTIMNIMNKMIKRYLTLSSPQNIPRWSRNCYAHSEGGSLRWLPLPTVFTQHGKNTPSKNK